MDPTAMSFVLPPRAEPDAVPARDDRWGGRRARRSRAAGGAAALTVGALMLAGAIPARPATSCSAVACDAVCTPAAPVAISTLVDFSDFPATAAADTPVAFVDPADGRSKRLIPTLEGTIWVWDGAAGEILPTPFLDLRDDVGGPVLAGGERGLLSMAVEPGYVESGRFYLFYTRADLGPGTQGDVVIERYQRSAADPDVADPASATTILVLDHPAGNHNGGQLAFGPDGFLYVSTGDGGGGCDGNQGANGDGQRGDTLHGKLLRLDVLGIDPMAGSPDDCSVEAGSYGVPSSNPFAGQEPACDEVWALGLRNPFRFSFDRLTGDLYLGDVGQRRWEEINIVRAATPALVNWGWPCREACETSALLPSNCSTAGCPVDVGTTCQFPRASGFWDPILCHDNDSGNDGGPGWASIMGGFRYRGSSVPSLAGDYLYGDAACGQIWKTTTLDPANPAAITASCWASGFQGTYGFAQDRLGELYVVVGGQGRIDCIHNGEGCFWAGWLFADDFESGDLTRWQKTKKAVP
jgi:hypothetical protein